MLLPTNSAARCNEVFGSPADFVCHCSRQFSPIQGSEVVVFSAEIRLFLFARFDVSAASSVVFSPVTGRWRGASFAHSSFDPDETAC